MEMIADFLLLSASVAACFYCYMLGRKLNNFKSTRNGIASSLAALSKSVEDAQTTIAHAHLAAEQSVGRLGPLLEQATSIEEKLRTDLAAVDAALNALIEARAEVLRNTVESVRDTDTVDTSDEDDFDIDDVDLDEIQSRHEESDDDNIDLAVTSPEAPAKPTKPETRPTSEDSFDIDLDDDGFEVEWNASDEAAGANPKDVGDTELARAAEKKPGVAGSKVTEKPATTGKKQSVATPRDIIALNEKVA